MTGENGKANRSSGAAVDQIHLIKIDPRDLPPAVSNWANLPYIHFSFSGGGIGSLQGSSNSSVPPYHAWLGLVIEPKKCSRREFLQRRTNKVIIEHSGRELSLMLFWCFVGGERL